MARGARIRGGWPVALAVLVVGGVLPLAPMAVAEDGGHLLISELVTGGTDAADEFVELYNPGPQPLPLEGLELVYLSATGTTPGRRVGWAAGAPTVPAGGHVLVANAAGVYAPVADATYAAGLASGGGTVALRIEGAAAAIDALGWGSAANGWTEGGPAPAPEPGASLERLPGGSAGSWTDTDDNASDFALRAAPEPQNSGSQATPPTAPSTPVPTVAPTPPPATPAATSSAAPGPSASPAGPVAIAAARALPDGTRVTITGTALTDAAATDGGGAVADAAAGIAVLASDPTSFARGERVTVTGVLDDRFAQRTLRAEPADIATAPGDGEWAATAVPTGSVGEAQESTLVLVEGTIQGAPTSLAAGMAYDVDDGSGPVRVLVGPTTGIPLGAWEAGAALRVVGVVGQRDSSGTGTAGYRVMPRDPADVQRVVPPAGPASPGSGPGASGTASPSPSAGAGAPAVMTVAEARAADRNAHVRVLATVTLGLGTIEAGSAAIQDATGGILVRLADEHGELRVGELVEIAGVRSTKEGMASVRADEPPARRGEDAGPAPASRTTGGVGEADEAMLVAVRGAVGGTPRRASSGTLSFDLDDGSGPLRIVLGPSLTSGMTPITAGSWVEVTGVVGQETSGSQPLEGYRIWPRSARDVRVLAPAIAPGIAGTGGARTAGGENGAAASTGPRLADVLALAPGSSANVEATLVHGPWPELGLAGVLWDGAQAVGLVADGASAVAVAELAGRGVPMAVSATIQGAASMPALAELGTVALDGEIVASVREPLAPALTLPNADAPVTWVRVTGLSEGGRSLETGPAILSLDVRCDEPAPMPEGPAIVTGIGLADDRIVLGCDGVRHGPALDSPRAIRGALRVTDAAPAPPADDGAGTRRGLAAALLGIGGSTLAAGAALTRRAPRPELPTDEPSEAEAREAESEMNGTASSEPRGLRLVPLPRERGSP